MKIRLKFPGILYLLSVIGLPATAQDTAFTYQGRLQSGTNFPSGSYDLVFTLYASNSGPSIIAGPVTNLAVGVANGLFTTAVDFGNVFAGSSNWLEIAVSTNGTGTFYTLTPRQQIRPTPYALYAGNLSGGLTVQPNTNGAPNVIGGSSVNYVADGVIGATVAGGGSTNYYKLGRTTTNRVTANFGTVGGGDDNIASGMYATVSGGFQIVASGYLAAVGGGLNNVASGQTAVVPGGYDNLASGVDSTVGGGNSNVASGDAAVVPGGFANIASGDYSFAAGNNARALHQGSFIWSDSTFTGFASTADNQFAVHATGGIRLAGDVQIDGGSAYHYLSLSGGNSQGFLYGSYPKFQDFVTLGYNYYADSAGSAHIPNTGGGTSRVSAGYGEVIVAVGGVDAEPTTTRIDATISGVSVYGTFNNNSDRNAKESFTPINTMSILDKIASLPLSEWSYKDDPKTRHIGPTAQDFYAALEIGSDDKHIAPIDEGGVAFAAIQALNKKLEEKDARIQKQDGEIADLKTRMEKLEQIITSKKADLTETSIESR